MVSISVSMAMSVIEPIASQSSSIIENVTLSCQDDPTLALAYFFFDSRDSQSALQLHENMIRSLLKQISTQQQPFPEELKRLYGDGHQIPSVFGLESTFAQILGKFQHVYIVLDALDECAQRARLLQ